MWTGNPTQQTKMAAVVVLAVSVPSHRPNTEYVETAEALNVMEYVLPEVSVGPAAMVSAWPLPAQVPAAERIVTAPPRAVAKVTVTV